MKFILSISMTLLLCIFLASSGNAQTGDATSTGSDTTITVKVKGATCSNDVKMIEASLNNIKGVSECKVGKKGATTSFTVQFDPKLVTKNEIHSAIEGTGSCDNPDARPYKIKQ